MAEDSNIPLELICNEIASWLDFYDIIKLESICRSMRDMCRNLVTYIPPDTICKNIIKLTIYTNLTKLELTTHVTLAHQWIYLNVSVSHLTKLKLLHFNNEYREIGDLSSLTSLTSLTSLKLSTQSMLLDSHAKCLTNLRTLEYNHIIDFYEDEEDLEDIDYDKLPDCKKIITGETLSSLTRLETLKIISSRYLNTSHFITLTNLTELRAPFNVDMSISTLVNLKYLDISSDINIDYKSLPLSCNLISLALTYPVNFTAECTYLFTSLQHLMMLDMQQTILGYNGIKCLTNLVSLFINDSISDVIRYTLNCPLTNLKQLNGQHFSPRQ